MAGRGRNCVAESGWLARMPASFSSTSLSLGVGKKGGVSEGWNERMGFVLWGVGIF